MQESHISDEYGPSILAPSIDKHLDQIAMWYVVNRNDSVALHILADDVQSHWTNDNLPDKERLKGIIEWWIDTKYLDILKDSNRLELQDEF